MRKEFSYYEKMMNLMCAACLAVTVTAAALPAEIAVYAEETAPTSGTLQGGQTWTLDGNGTLTISGTGEMKERQETDYPWDLQREAVKKLVIQDGVTNIGSYAFHDCHALAEVTIPQSVTYIDRGRRVWLLQRLGVDCCCSGKPQLL